MKDIIEIMARAMWKLDPLDETGEMKWRYYSPEAQAAAKALKASGYAIVPVEPTEQQKLAMGGAFDFEDAYEKAIKAGDKS